MIERHAERYTDDFVDTKTLANAARRRLAWRMRRAGARACVVCGGPILGRSDADTCSGKCRVAKFRQRAKL